MNVGTICPHCKHSRTDADDSTPAWVCPACGKKYYEKVEAEKPKQVTTGATRLIPCLSCSTSISIAAKACPKCGHPNQNVTSSIGVLVGAAALILGIASLFLPYFVIVFLVPATAVAAVVAIVLGERKMGGFALFLALIGAFSIIHTSNKIASIERETKAQLRQIERDAKAAEEQFRRSMRETPRY